MGEHIVILTGAGISADSGIKTFRDNDGLWEDHRVEDVATPEAFIRNPELVQRFYNLRRSDLQNPDIKPNPAHIALAKLEREFPGKVTIVTQNVDNLHERGGSKNVLHMHGELLKVRCVRSGKVREFTGEITAETRCECCKEPQVLRPHIVWFGEMPLYMEEIYQALAEATCFVSIGTSGNVYPAAGFVNEVRAKGIPTIEINMEPSANQFMFGEGYYGPAAIEVPKWVEKILKE